MFAYSPSPFPLSSSLILSFLSPVCSFTSLHFIISFSFPSSSYPSLILPLISSSFISILSPSPLFILLFRHSPSSYRLLDPSFSLILHLLHFLLELSLIPSIYFFFYLISTPLHLSLFLRRNFLFLIFTSISAFQLLSSFRSSSLPPFISLTSSLNDLSPLAFPPAARIIRAV